MSLAAYKQTAPRTLGRVLKGEILRSFTMASLVLLAGSGAERSVDVGAVLGQRLLGSATGATVAGGTGDGAIGSITRGIDCKDGEYWMTCIATAANGGRFQVVDPDGLRLPDALVGVAYVHPQIAFTISDGAADFAVGDQRKITVAAGDMKVVPIDFSAVDGTQYARAIAGKAATAPDGDDVPVLAIDWGALVDAGELLWPAGATTDQKTAALARLAATRNILARAEA